jgi:transcriptional regulator with XRE-family HTH domain
VIGPSFDEVHRELVAHDPTYETLYRETLFEDELALGLAELRHERQLSQRQLAERLAVRQPMIARIEKGAQIPTATTLFKFATVLQARIEITPDGATVSQYVPKQVGLPVFEAQEHGLIPPSYGIGYMPTGSSFWSGPIMTWATVNTGQLARQEPQKVTVPMLSEGINDADVINAWGRSLKLNQESVREPIAAQQSLSVVPERSAA